MSRSDRLAVLPSNLLAAAVLVACAFAGTARGADWPQLLGPTRDGRYPGDELLTSVGDGGLKVLWTKEVGHGFSGPVVAGKHVLLFQRVGEEETLVSYDAGDGKTLWSHSYPTAYDDDFGFDDGPRATPAVVNDRCYTFGAEGVLSAVALEDGRRHWQVKTHERFEVKKGFFGAACSPLVAGGRVIVNVGGADGSGIVAFDAASGDVLWKATSDEASYSSPAIANIDGVEHALVFTRSGLVDVDPASGAVRFKFPWQARIRASVNAATPLVDGSRVFISASYSTGAATLALEKDAEPRVLWKSDGALSCHYATPVLDEGVLYGFHGRQEAGPALRAVSLSDGRVLWEKAAFGAGTLMIAGDVLWVVGEDGAVTLVAASPLAFKSLGRSVIAAETVRAYPALADGRLFLRSETRLYCVDVAAAGRPARGEEAKEPR